MLLRGVVGADLGGLEKLVRQLGLEPDPACHAITCFLVARVEAYPRRGADLSEGEIWTGPEALIAHAGFRVLRDDPTSPVVSLALGDGVR